MVSGELKDSISTQFKIKKVLWIGLTAGLILYLLAVYFITSGKSPNDNLSIQTEYLFAAGVFILLISAIIFRKYTFSDSKLKNIFLRGNNMGTIDNTTRTTNEMESSDIATKLNKYLSRQQISFIISLAINDSIGILGIGIGFISRDLSKAMPYIACALLLNILVYPRTERFLYNLKSFGQY